MSSSSLSDCMYSNSSKCTYCIKENRNNYGYKQYESSQKSSGHFPIYPALARPLIYFAEVQKPEIKKKGNDHSKKEHRNYFVKAFKWYTQERQPKPNETDTDQNDFANWLDSKYIEYLRERTRPQESGTTQPRAPGCKPSDEPNTNKRCSRIKGPWKKRRCSENESGDVPHKCQSFEFILQPKDLTRPASECCQTPVSDGNKSNATEVSSDVHGNTKVCGKCHSLGNVNLERSAPKYKIIVTHIGQEGSKQEANAPAPCKQRTPQAVQVPSQSRAEVASCQCPDEKVVLVHGETQYECRNKLNSRTQGLDDKSTPDKTPSRAEVKPPKIEKNKQKRKKKASVSCQCPPTDDKANTPTRPDSTVRVDVHVQPPHDHCKCQPERIRSCHHQPDAIHVVVRDPHQINQVFGPKPMRNQSTISTVYSTVAVTEGPHDTIVKEVTIVSKFTQSVTCLENDGVQTSDHAICFENGMACPYPLFLKIVCADNECNDCKDC